MPATTIGSTKNENAADPAILEAFIASSEYFPSISLSTTIIMPLQTNPRIKGQDIVHISEMEPIGCDVIWYDGFEFIVRLNLDV